jgi:phenylacetate-CoA ligase
MSLFHALRRQLFWLTDRLNGNQIRKHYQEIELILNNHHCGHSESIRKQNLNNILTYAVNTTPFYKKYKGFDTLASFPVINKNIILEHYEDFRSIPLKTQKLAMVSSSGSTGIPFHVFQDRIKKNRNTADAIYYLEKAGGVFGSTLFFLKLWDDKNRKRWFTRWMQNIYAHNVMESSPANLDYLLMALERDRSSKTIMGYPSFFEELCNHLSRKEKPIKVNRVNAVISIAESLDEKVKSGMENYFDTSVYERYSNQENGILAQRTKDFSMGYKLNTASYHFEFLALDTDQPVAPGEVARIVVTDLFNHAMPMIRYDTGDLALVEQTEYGCLFLNSIQGRRYDAIFDTQERLISPHFLYRVLDYGTIRQFQFVQYGRKSYQLRLNARRQDVQEEQILAFCKDYLGVDAEITFDYVDEIPLLSSGKRKKVVNTTKKG